MTKIKLSKIDGRSHVGIVCRTNDEALKLFAAYRSLGIKGAKGQTLGRMTNWKLHGINTYYFHKYGEVYIGNCTAGRKVPMRFVNFTDVVLPHQERHFDLRYISSNTAINCQNVDEANILLSHWFKIGNLYGNVGSLLEQWQKFGSGTCYHRTGATLHADHEDTLTQAGYEVIEFNDVILPKFRK